MGDSTFWHRLRLLAAGDVPRIALDVSSWDGPEVPSGSISITEAGRAVLLGGVDAIRLRGFDKWLGGTHLRAAAGGDIPWRYDPVAGRLRWTGEVSAGGRFTDGG